MSAALITEVDFHGRWTWQGGAVPARYSLREGVLSVTAPAGADHFRMPGVREVASLPLLCRPVEGDFTAVVTVSAAGQRFADAAGLALVGLDGVAKLCVERMPDGRWAICTVVSDPHSDEAAGPTLAGPVAQLMITRERSRVAMFHRQPGEPDWHFTRTFTSAVAGTRLALFAQAPLSEACTGEFSGFDLSPGAQRDRR
ncbi:regulation of enolase protein 1 (concanavalin A-like superfamily) [Crossiella equi]|uniref:Regulation of enolase protein 1 (Concanavalin A-like superfamily) n=1 Tax=Crossiella equi TaxID=130796 RepID=A0ABS5APY3_9PSEU|nr:DUF1349 domain-containing protein [Crossiella equi]MBP2478627.1 regulation of enolase protein 1 (concanavalin A-like superfamily) [Crossiella equi]